MKDPRIKKLEEIKQNLSAPWIGNEDVHWLLTELRAQLAVNQKLKEVLEKVEVAHQIDCDVYEAFSITEYLVGETVKELKNG